MPVTRDCIVWETPFEDAFDGTNGDDVTAFASCSLVEALSVDYPSEAMLAPYIVEDDDGPVEAFARLKKKSLAAVKRMGCRVVFYWMVIDVDAPDKKDKAAVELFVADALALLPTILPWPKVGFYSTPGGYRLFWRLPEALDPVAWEAANEAAQRELRGRGVKGVDPACKNWDRGYRLPSIIRDGARTVSTVKLPDGVFALEVTKPASVFADVAAAKTTPGFTLPDTLPAGTRHKTLVSYAGKLRAAGATAVEILAALRAVTAERCVDDVDVDDDKLQQIASSVGGYDTEFITEIETGSDHELADYVLAMLEGEGESLVYDHEAFWRYSPDSGCWEPLHVNVIERALKTLDGVTFGPKAQRLHTGASKTRNVVEACRIARQVVGFFDDASAGVVFANGRVVLSDDGEAVYHPHSPDARSRWAIPCDYDPGANGALWAQTLETCFRDTDDGHLRADVLAEAAGACLFGVATRYQKAIMLVGEGDNGKSTVLEPVLALFPTRARCSISPQAMDGEYNRAMLADKAINVVSEVPKADIESAEAFKAAVSGDEMNGRHIRQDPFTFRPRAGHLFAANELPEVRDYSRGFWRRWLLIGFDRQIPKAEQIPDLGRRLTAEQLPAIALWAVEGAKRLVTAGKYTEPPSSVEQASQWRSDADHVLTFATDVLVKLLEEHGPQKSSAICAQYDIWCQKNRMGKERLSAVKIVRRLKFLGCRHEKQKTGRFFVSGPKISGGEKTC